MIYTCTVVTLTIARVRPSLSHTSTWPRTVRTVSNTRTYNHGNFSHYQYYHSLSLHINLFLAKSLPEYVLNLHRSTLYNTGSSHPFPENGTLNWLTSAIAVSFNRPSFLGFPAAMGLLQSSVRSNLIVWYSCSNFNTGLVTSPYLVNTLR